VRVQEGADPAIERVGGLAGTEADDDELVTALSRHDVADPAGLLDRPSGGEDPAATSMLRRRSTTTTHASADAMAR